MRLLVTGATGFVGRHLSSHLRSEGHEVVTLDVGGDVDHAVDVRSAAEVSKAIEAAGADGVFHLAAVAFVPEADSDPAVTEAVNFDGTVNVLDAAERAAARTLFISSGAVYGRLAAADLPATEDRALEPEGAYAESKARGEHECVRRAGRQHIVRVRPFNHTGPGQSPAYVCSDFAKQIAECEAGRREPALAVGDLSAERDFSDVRDVVRAYLGALVDGRPGDVYNVCSGAAVPISRILDVLRSLARVEVRVDVEEERLRGGEISRAYGSFSKLEAATAWRPSIPLEQTLSDLLAYWREQVAAAS